jgi:hypothetical protein
MKRMTASYIINILEFKYRTNMHILNNSSCNKEKTKLLIKKELLEEIIFQIEEKQIELNGGINYK